MYSEKDIFFGSFARRTKKRELDDIDMMITLDAQASCYNEFTDRIEIYVSDYANRLKALCYENTNILSSRRVINKFISLLNQIPQYEKAEINRNMEAATLHLKSYTWNFDLVPCFFTQKDWFNKDYYLQTQIYDNRRRSPLIVDWLYSLLKREHEQQMNKGAESLAQELMQSP